MLPPISSVWVRNVTKDLNSSRPTRSASRNNASFRAAPACISCVAKSISSPRASFCAFCSLPTRFNAASTPIPASTQTTIKSSVSGSVSRISRTRARDLRNTVRKGNMYPTAAPAAVSSNKSLMDACEVKAMSKPPNPKAKQRKILRPQKIRTARLPR